ncbi:MAG: polysaccharide deacetylase family protein [Chthoniobacteraceae bacterium]
MRRWLKERTADMLGGLLRPWFGGIGCIVTLHRIVPEDQRSPIPQNRAMEIRPGALRSILDWVSRNGFDVVRLDEVRARLGQPRGNKFICFAFDDGYRDNLTEALPIFRDFGYPFAINVTTGFLDRTASVWWYFLEDVLARRASLALEWGGEAFEWSWTTPGDRTIAFSQIASLVRAQDGAGRDALLQAIGEVAGIDPLARTRELILSWEELRQLAGHWHVTVGSHSVGHHVLARLSEADLARELSESRTMIEARLGKRVQHFAYPFGGRDAAGPREFAAALEADYVTGLTTRSGNLFREHAWHLLTLPRLAIEGNFPPLGLLQKLESGFLPARGNGWKRIVTQ